MKMNRINNQLLSGRGNDGQQSFNTDSLSPAIPVQFFLLFLLSFIGGAFVTVFLLPTVIPGLQISLQGDMPKAYWYLSRSSAFVAYGLLWISMLLGLSITNRTARVWPGAFTAYDLHQYTTLLGLAFGLFHAFILLGDRYSNFTLSQILTPFTTTGYRPVWVGLGQISLYLSLIIALSFYARRWIGKNTWRIIHFASFAVFVMVLIHGIFSGTDSPSDWTHYFYWVTGASVLFFTVYRILATRFVVRQKQVRA